jgi:uncharacterized protein (DUF362 family)
MGKTDPAGNPAAHSGGYPDGHSDGHSDVFIFRDRIDLSFIVVNPGDVVVLKPNLVKEHNEAHPEEWESVITSEFVLRRVCEDVARKLAGRGHITIGDAPQTDSRFSEVARKLHLIEMANEYQEKYGVPVTVTDWRNEEWTNQDGIITARRRLSGDPLGSVAFNLGARSLFYGHAGEGRYYGADYDSAVVNRHHHGDRQEYLVCATPIHANVFINLPKMKTHKKAGVTLNLKNLVGINADKNWLPHHTDSDPRTGVGDQFVATTPFRRLEQRAVKLVRKMALRYPEIGTRLARFLRRAGTRVFGDGGSVVRSGNWHGNDTCWRMVLDLNRCLLYGNPDGSIRNDRPKRYYSLIDGGVGMQGAGPMHGEPMPAGVYIGGSDPAAVDAVAARVMGFDWRRIPVIREAFALKELPISASRPEDIVIHSEIPGWSGRLADVATREFLRFEPHFGWKGHIEYVLGH